MSGLFVVFEGGDGVGKTTQVDLLCAALIEHGYDVVRTREPGDTALGREIRRLVLDPASGDVAARAEALLYAADKAQHVTEVVGPALRRGAVVVCDRYVDSMIAYQGAGRVLDVGAVTQLATWATGGLRPSLTVVLDVDRSQGVDAKLAKDRVEAAGGGFHDRARHFFLELAAAEPERYLVLAGRRPRDELAAEITARVLHAIEAQRAYPDLSVPVSTLDS